jgi:hypothetical protein
MNRGISVVKLLNIDANAKTVKGQSKGFMTAVLYLAPFKASGFNVCPMAEIAGCIAGCLNTAGRGGIAANRATFRTPVGRLPDNAIQRARIARTRFYAEGLKEFMAQLVRELEAFCRKADKAGLVPAVRLNGTSDIRFEVIPCQRNGMVYPHIYDAFSAVQFYDYTKISNRRIAGITNYHLSYSYSARPEYQPHVAKAMAQGLNIVAVFRKELPETFLGRRVVNGDESDLRFLDPAQVVVGLKAKGRARKDTGGFVVDYVKAIAA